MSSRDGANPGSQLLAAAIITLPTQAEPVPLQRGMLVLNRDGQPAGRLAALSRCRADGALTHLLLGQVPAAGHYRLVPITAVSAVTADQVRLTLTAAAIDTLPLHQPE